jgi:hypothetical protein
MIKNNEKSIRSTTFRYWHRHCQSDTNDSLPKGSPTPLKNREKRRPHSKNFLRSADNLSKNGGGWRVKKNTSELKTTQRIADKLIKTVNDQIAVLEEQIFCKIDGDDSLKEKFVLLQSMPGIGRIVAVTLLIDCPELATA